MLKPVRRRRRRRGEKVIVREFSSLLKLFKPATHDNFLHPRVLLVGKTCNLTMDPEGCKNVDML